MVTTSRVKQTITGMPAKMLKAAAKARQLGLEVIGLSVVLACGRSDHSYVTVYRSLSDSIVRLPSGDSVEVQATGPAVVAGEPTGVLVIYHPFFSLEDTLHLRKVALALFHSIEPRLERKPPFVVLRAVDRRAAERTGMYQLNAFGIVVERRSDGRWYLLGGTNPVE